MVLYVEGDVAHTLEPSRDHTLALTKLDRLGSIDKTLESRGAHLVYGSAWLINRETTR